MTHWERSVASLKGSDSVWSRAEYLTEIPCSWLGGVEVSREWML